MGRAERRAKTKLKQERRQQIWQDTHRFPADVGYRAKYLPMHCRCGWCSRSRTRYKKILDKENIIA